MMEDGIPTRHIPEVAQITLERDSHKVIPVPTKYISVFIRLVYLVKFFFILGDVRSHGKFV